MTILARILNAPRHLLFRVGGAGRCRVFEGLVIA